MSDEEGMNHVIGLVIEDHKKYKKLADEERLVYAIQEKEE